MMFCRNAFLLIIKWPKPRSNINFYSVSMCCTVARSVSSPVRYCTRSRLATSTSPSYPGFEESQPTSCTRNLPIHQHLWASKVRLGIPKGLWDITVLSVILNHPALFCAVTSEMIQKVTLSFLIFTSTSIFAGSILGHRQHLYVRYIWSQILRTWAILPLNIFKKTSSSGPWAYGISSCDCIASTWEKEEK